LRAMGGWVALCDRTTDDLKWAEQEFRRTYEALYAAGVASEQCLALPGIMEAEAGRNGEGEVETVDVAVGLPQTAVRVIPSAPVQRRLENRVPLPVIRDTESTFVEPVDNDPSDAELESRRNGQLAVLGELAVKGDDT